MAPPDLTAEFRKVHQFTTFAVSTPMQCGIADFLQSDPEFFENLSGFYQQRRDHFCKELESTRFHFEPSKSTFFQIIDYGDVTQDGDVSVAKDWTRDIGVASIPLSVFCANKTITGTKLRFCFAKDDAILTAAVEKLREL